MGRIRPPRRRRRRPARHEQRDPDRIGVGESEPRGGDHRRPGRSPTTLTRACSSRAIRRPGGRPALPGRARGCGRGARRHGGRQPRSRCRSRSVVQPSSRRMATPRSSASSSPTTTSRRRSASSPSSTRRAGPGEHPGLPRRAVRRRERSTRALDQTGDRRRLQARRVHGDAGHARRSPSVVFGTLVAAGIPLLLGLTAVMAAIGLLSRSRATVSRWTKPRPRSSCSSALRSASTTRSCYLTREREAARRGEGQPGRARGRRGDLGARGARFRA